MQGRAAQINIMADFGAERTTDCATLYRYSAVMSSGSVSRTTLQPLDSVEGMPNRESFPQHHSSKTLLGPEGAATTKAFFGLVFFPPVVVGLF